MTLDVYSFELHQEIMDKRKSWIIEASEGSSHFKKSYFLVITFSADKC